MRQWDEDMGEISGFGGSYEQGCRAMVLAGINWLDEHPNAQPQFKGSPQIFGVVLENNPDAEALTNAIMSAEITDENGKVMKCREEATGAMHHAAVNHCLAYKKLGWDEYRRQLCEYQRARTEARR